MGQDDEAEAEAKVPARPSTGEIAHPGHPGHAGERRAAILAKPPKKAWRFMKHK